MRQGTGQSSRSALPGLWIFRKVLQGVSVIQTQLLEQGMWSGLLYSLETGTGDCSGAQDRCWARSHSGAPCSEALTVFCT